MVKNEYGKLLQAALVFPASMEYGKLDKEYHRIQSSNISWFELYLEFQQLYDVLKQFGVDIKFTIGSPNCPNNIFARDLATVLPDGDVYLSNMKYESRKKEPEGLGVVLAGEGFIVRQISEFEVPTIEGADVFVLDQDTLAISTGNRTSDWAVDYFLGCITEVIAVKALPEGIPQHLLGRMHIISEYAAIIRSALFDFSDPDTRRLLDRFAVVYHVPEDEEVTVKLAMNIVTLAPNTILMPAGCPDTKKFYEDIGLKVYTSPMTEMVKLGGGLLAAAGQINGHRWPNGYEVWI